MKHYVWPDAVRRLCRELGMMSGGAVCLIGLQGVGKSSALSALFVQCIRDRMRKTAPSKKTSKEKKVESSIHETYGVHRFKWRRRAELFSSLLTHTHELSRHFLPRYCARLVELLEPRFPLLKEQLNGHPDRLNIAWAERTLGKTTVDRSRQSVWIEMLADVETVLIDTPDYSKTDRRLAAKDLDEMYWLWSFLTRLNKKKPNLIITIQKEMFGRHYFFDKMTKVELQPVSPEQMVEAYRLRFKVIRPFTDDALLTISKMSRGIFRRFLRYITLTLDMWEAQHRPQTTINKTIVAKAITAERMAEDLEPEMQELFPKQSELRLQAVQILTHLDRSGPMNQSQLGEELEIEPYTMSRILSNLELHRYIKRKRSKNDKIVAPRNISEKEDPNPPSETTEPSTP